MAIRKRITDAKPTLQDIANMSYRDGHDALLKYYNYKFKGHHRKFGKNVKWA